MANSLFEHLTERACTAGITLYEAYKLAGIDDSRFYRHRSGEGISERNYRRLVHVLESRHPARKQWEASLREQFKCRRLRLRLTQRDVEEKIGCADYLVGKWEVGMRRPSGFLLCCWADALKSQMVLVPNEMLEAVHALIHTV